MKKVFFIRPGAFPAALLSFLIFLIYHQPISATGIRFEKDSFAVLLQKAGKEKKMIFIDCVTSWCPPCRRMEKNVFPNDTVGDFYNSHFICATFDMEKGEGKTLANRYDVGCYPTYLFLDEKGNLVHRHSGEWSVAEFIALGHAALSPELQFATIERHCASGKATPGEMLHYLKLRKATYLSIDTALEAYMQAQPDSSLSNRENWTLIHTYNPPPWNHMFRYLLDHQQEFSEKYTQDSVNNLVSKVYAFAMAHELNYLYGTPDTAAYSKLRAEVVNLHLPYLESLICWNDMDYFICSGTPDAFAKAACLYVRNYCDSTGPSISINLIIWKFSQQNVTDTAYLDTAISWAARSVALQPNYNTTRNYAHLLFNRGRKQEAEAQTVSAIQFAEKAGIDVAEEKELLKKIRAMK